MWFAPDEDQQQVGETLRSTSKVTYIVTQTIIIFLVHSPPWMGKTFYSITAVYTYSLFYAMLAYFSPCILFSIASMSWLVDVISLFWFWETQVENWALYSSTGDKCKPATNNETVHSQSGKNGSCRTEWEVKEKGKIRTTSSRPLKQYVGELGK